MMKAVSWSNSAVELPDAIIPRCTTNHSVSKKSKPSSKTTNTVIQTCRESLPRLAADDDERYQHNIVISVDLLEELSQLSPNLITPALQVSLTRARQQRLRREVEQKREDWSRRGGIEPSCPPPTRNPTLCYSKSTLEISEPNRSLHTSRTTVCEMPESRCSLPSRLHSSRELPSVLPQLAALPCVLHSKLTPTTEPKLARDLQPSKSRNIIDFKSPKSRFSIKVPTERYDFNGDYSMAKIVRKFVFKRPIRSGGDDQDARVTLQSRLSDIRNQAKSPAVLRKYVRSWVDAGCEKTKFSDKLTGDISAQRPPDTDTRRALTPRTKYQRISSSSPLSSASSSPVDC